MVSRARLFVAADPVSSIPVSVSVPVVAIPIPRVARLFLAVVP